MAHVIVLPGVPHERWSLPKFIGTASIACSRKPDDLIKALFEIVGR